MAARADAGPRVQPSLALARRIPRLDSVEIRLRQRTAWRCADATMCPDADPREGMIPLRSALDPNQLRRLLGLPVNVLRTSLLGRTSGDRYHAAFRYCRQCAAHGYHSVLHQLAEEHRCAAHRQELRTQCLQCRRQSPFIINSSVIEAPFRCVWCRSHFCYGLLPVRSTTPAMRRQDRLAIQDRMRLRLGRDASGGSNG